MTKVVETPTEHHHAPDAHAGHGAHMVRDMLRRFVGSAILTVPIINLMKDDPADVPAALVLARRVHRKISRISSGPDLQPYRDPVAAGALYPSLGILLKPAWAALRHDVVRSCRGHPTHSSGTRTAGA